MILSKPIYDKFIDFAYFSYEKLRRVRGLAIWHFIGFVMAIDSLICPIDIIISPRHSPGFVPGFFLGFEISHCAGGDD